MSVHEPPIGTRHAGVFFMRMVSSLLLFSAPVVHLRSLRKIWVDRILRHHAYDSLINKLNEEWQDFILLVSSNDSRIMLLSFET